jgi:hypothetical protein
MHDAVRHWLAAGSTAADLAATGYNLQAVQQHFAAAAAALFDAWGNGAGDTEITALTGALRELGSALCLLAAQPICNNPACANVSGPSETLLASGRSCVCGGCRIAHYCSKPCQQEHWKQHKPVCKALAAAAAGAQPIGVNMV